MVDARNAFAISAAWLGSPDLYLIARTFVPMLNFGSTLCTREEAIHSSMLSRPKEPEFRKPCWTCGLAVKFNRLTTSTATR